MRPLIGFVSASLLLAACGGGSASPGGGGLEGATWILDSPSTGSLVHVVPPKARVTLRFDGGNVSGTAACNTFGGTYATSGDSGLTISVGAITEMACPEPVMALESAYLAALGDVSGYQVAGGGRSLLLTGGTVALTFMAEQPLPLVGTLWTLNAVASGDVVSSVIAGTEVTATFGADGSVGGSGGCNRYGGTFTAEGETIAIADIASTQVACRPGGVSTQERAFFAGLPKAASFAIEGASLTLYDAQGAMLLGFTGS